MKREENWNHVSIRTSKRHKCAYDKMITKINKNIGVGLTGEQHTALMILSEYRHYLHRVRENYLEISDADKSELGNFFKNQMGILLKTSKLPALNLRYFPIEMGESSEIITAYIDTANEKIENYLAAIDRKHGTMYCPSGIRRNVRRGILAAAEM